MMWKREKKEEKARFEKMAQLKKAEVSVSDMMASREFNPDFETACA